MAEPFLAEIRIVSFVFPPQGWALCNGQLLPINQNQALFSLLGTTYGGNGATLAQVTQVMQDDNVGNPTVDTSGGAGAIDLVATLPTVPATPASCTPPSP